MIASHNYRITLENKDVNIEMYNSYLDIFLDIHTEQQPKTRIYVMISVFQLSICRVSQQEQTFYSMTWRKISK